MKNSSSIIESVTESFSKARNYWLAYAAFWVAGYAVGFFGFSFVTSFLQGLFAFASTGLLFYIAYRLGTIGVNRKGVIILGAGMVIVFISLIFLAPAISIGDAAVFLNWLLWTSLVILFYGGFAALVIFVGHSVGWRSKKDVQKAIKGQTEFAGFWQRALAYTIDSILLSLLVIPVVFVASWDYPNRSTAGIAILLFIIWIIGSQFYFVYFHKKTGQTIGKKVLGLRVVKKDLSGLSWGDALARLIVFDLTTSLFLLYAGSLWIAIDKEKQGWHDKAAGTYVIKLKE